MSQKHPEAIPQRRLDAIVRRPLPCDTVRIEHAQLQVELVSERDGASLSSPWLSIAVDECTGRVMTWRLSRNAPDPTTTPSLLDEVARLHRRYPSTLILDDHGDFRSPALDQFCVVHGVARQRGAPSPNLRTSAERVCGMLNARFSDPSRDACPGADEGRASTAPPTAGGRWRLSQLKVAIDSFIDEACGDHGGARPTDDASGVARQAAERI